MNGADNERESYRRIISRAKRARERAAESLRRSRALRKQRGNAGNKADESPKRPRSRASVDPAVGLNITNRGVHHWVELTDVR